MRSNHVCNVSSKCLAHVVVRCWIRVTAAIFLHIQSLLYDLDFSCCMWSPFLLKKKNCAHFSNPSKRINFLSENSPLSFISIGLAISEHPGTLSLVSPYPEISPVLSKYWKIPPPRTQLTPRKKPPL